MNYGTAWKDRNFNHQTIRETEWKSKQHSLASSKSTLVVGNTILIPWNLYIYPVLTTEGGGESRSRRWWTFMPQWVRFQLLNFNPTLCWTTTIHCGWEAVHLTGNYGGEGLERGQRAGFNWKSHTSNMLNGQSSHDIWNKFVITLIID